MVKSKTLTVILLLLLFIFSATVLAAEFWGSKNSNKYHYSTCVWAQKVKPANLVKFNSPEAAVKAGYIPCKVCKPPVASSK